MNSWYMVALVLAFTCASCTRTVRTVHYGSGRNAVSTVSTQHIENAVDAGDGDLQLRALRQRVALDSRDLEARMMLARLYAQKGLPDVALEHYRLAHAQFPDSAVVTLSLAKTLREMGALEEALQVARAGGNWQSLSLQGILEDELGRLGRAETAHRNAVELEPLSSSLHNNLGYNLLLQNKREEAAKEFRRAIELDPRSEIAHNNLATALAGAAKGSDALAELQRGSLQHGSGDAAMAHSNLAALLIDQGRYAEAREEIELALKLRQGLPSALQNLKLVAELDGKPATMPVGRRVNLWARVTSGWGKLTGGGHRASAPKPATADLGGEN